jgi:adenylate cyclase
VTSRNATFAYKGQVVDVRKVGGELGVRYILEGSVRRDGNRVRITAQLVDVQSGHHLWAERYDRELIDKFALQDEITRNIITALQTKLKGTKPTGTQTARIESTGPGPAETDGKDSPMVEPRSPRPADQRPGLMPSEGPRPSQRHDKRGMAVARSAAEKAMAENPNDPQPYVDLAWTYILEVRFGASESPPDAMDQAEKLARKAIELDPSLTGPYGVLTNVSLNRGEYDQAVAEGRQVVSIAPDSADAHAYLALALHYDGRPEEAVTQFKKALDLSPKPPAWYLERLGMTYFLTGKYREAIDLGKKALQADPTHMPARILLVAGYAALGDDSAVQKVVRVIQRAPGFRLARFRKSQPYKNPEDLERIVKTLQQAGMR